MWVTLGILWSLLFLLLAIASWIATLFGAPGLWVLVAAAVLNAWLVPKDYMVYTPWWSVGVLIGLALLGELVEFLASALGVQRLGGSHRASILAIVGSLVGAFAGFFIGIPIPLVGSLIATVLFSGLGALAGAMLGEAGLGTEPTQNLKIGIAAFVGRVFGTVGKGLCGAAMVAVVAVVIFT